MFLQAGNEENADPKAKPVNAILKKVREIEARVKEEVTTKKVVPVRETRSKSKQEIKEKQVVVKVIEETKIEISTKSSDEESSLYVSALETISADESLLIITPIKKGKPKARTPSPPAGVVDFDKENWTDPLQVSVYAMDVFKYLKTRESNFIVSDYMPKQVSIVIKTLLFKFNFFYFRR